LGRGLIWIADQFNGREWASRRPRCEPGELLIRIWYLHDDLIEGWFEEGTTLFMGIEPDPKNPGWNLCCTWEPRAGRQEWSEWDFYHNFRRYPDEKTQATDSRRR
jgi:hypothetical protein